MKTAISVPDELFTSADALAQRLGISRSELYARAMAEYVAKHRTEAMTDRLNRVYAEEESGLPDELRQAQARSIRANEW